MEDNKRTKSDVQEKIQKQIDKKREKNETLGIYRIFEYMKEEHKWENVAFVIIATLTLALGLLMHTDVLVADPDFPVIGKFPTAFAWCLVGFGGAGLLYALYPFFKPAFPEFKKISWLPLPKFIGNVIRVFLFLLILTSLFLLYDAFIAQILDLIF